MAGRSGRLAKEVFLTTDQIDEVLLKGHEEALLLNASRSTEFVVNNRQQRLNVRTVWPSATPQGVVICLHGFSLHCNRPTEQYFGDFLAVNGLGSVFIDFHGHGHSEGKRCLINNAEDLIDDVLCVLLALFADSNEGPNYSLHQTAKNLPFFFFGHSTGAATALIVGNLLSVDRDAKVSTPYARECVAELAERAGRHFMGVIAVAPMAKVPTIVKRVVGSIGCLLPNATLPSIFRTDEWLGNMMWASPKYFKYVLSDRYPTYPHGLTYWGGSRVPTLRSVIAIAAHVKQAIEQCSFPILILHDKYDEFVTIEGSHELMELCPSADKRLVLVPDGMHDPLTNRLDYMCKIVLEWLSSHTA